MEENCLTSSNGVVAGLAKAPRPNPKSVIINQVKNGFIVVHKSNDFFNEQEIAPTVEDAIKLASDYLSVE